MPTNWWFEVLKLLLQLAGAYVVARHTVRWALSRYKAEKTWERQLGAYSDVVSALGEMRIIVGIWIDELELGNSPAEEARKDRASRYRSARRRVEDGTAIARLIMCSQAADRLTDLLRKFELMEGSELDYTRVLQIEWKELTEALDELIACGRTELKL